MISASNADHDDTDDWLAIMNRQRIMVPERLRGTDNGTNMFLAVSYLRPFTVISATADLLRIRARAEAIDSNILAQASLARATRIHSVRGWQGPRMIDDACFFPHRPANPALSRLPCPNYDGPVTTGRPARANGGIRRQHPSFRSL